jgi:hypothetical protein
MLVRCPHCKQANDIASGLAGGMFACASCHRMFALPKAGDRSDPEAGGLQRQCQGAVRRRGDIGYGRPRLAALLPTRWTAARRGRYTGGEARRRKGRWSPGGRA